MTLSLLVLMQISFIISFLSYRWSFLLSTLALVIIFWVLMFLEPPWVYTFAKLCTSQTFCIVCICKVLNLLHPLFFLVMRYLNMMENPYRILLSIDILLAHFSVVHWPDLGFHFLCYVNISIIQPLSTYLQQKGFFAILNHQWIMAYIFLRAPYILQPMWQWLGR